MVTNIRPQMLLIEHFGKELTSKSFSAPLSAKMVWIMKEKIQFLYQHFGR